MAELSVLAVTLFIPAFSFPKDWKRSHFLYVSMGPLRSRIFFMWKKRACVCLIFSIEFFFFNSFHILKYQFILSFYKRSEGLKDLTTLHSPCMYWVHLLIVSFWEHRMEKVVKWKIIHGIIWCEIIKKNSWLSAYYARCWSELLSVNHFTLRITREMQLSSPFCSPWS